MDFRRAGLAGGLRLPQPGDRVGGAGGAEDDAPHAFPHRGEVRVVKLHLVHYVTRVGARRHEPALLVLQTEQKVGP